ncbi:MAG: propanediol utilization protein [Actinobacteria bacterium]|nr:propanediol utilization protein [Actinomycetota bacterium]MBS1882118.1 propanediol utilization protein [Actinomycetota bacterium]
MTLKAWSGRPVEEITVERVVAGELAAADLRVHPDTLRAQADVAAAHGNPQLAANLRRAAELTALADERLLEIYEALRPGRSTRAGLEAIVAELEAEGAPMTAAIVREALVGGEERGLLAEE